MVEEKKTRCRNFPTFLLRGLFEVSEMGEEKYGTYDFLNGKLTVNDHLDSLKRHMIKLEDPNVSDFDHESKKLHAYHMAWRALMTAYTIENHPELDDRFKGLDIRVENTPRAAFYEAVEAVNKEHEDLLIKMRD